MNTLDLMNCAMRFPSSQALRPTRDFIPIEFDGITTHKNMKQ